MNLPSPLTTSERSESPKLGRHKVVKLTASVHRQMWVGGAQIFTDVHISNSSRKHTRKITLELERSTFFYTNAAADTTSGPAEHLRLPDRAEREVLAKKRMKMARYGRQVIPSDSQDVRTLSLDIPQVLMTVDTGRWKISEAARGTFVNDESSLHKCDHLQSLIVCNSLTTQ